MIAHIMPNQPLFAGLVVDENGNVAETAYVGEPMYVVNDAGFRRISSEQVDNGAIRDRRDDERQ
jgi:hypothetical protein